MQDETYRQGLHELHETQKMADEVCRYDLDELDTTWLANYNELRREHGNVQEALAICCPVQSVWDVGIGAVRFLAGRRARHPCANDVEHCLSFGRPGPTFCDRMHGGLG